MSKNSFITVSKNGMEKKSVGKKKDDKKKGEWIRICGGRWHMQECKDFASKELKKEEEELFPVSRREMLSKSHKRRSLDDTTSPTNVVFPTNLVSSTPMITPQIHRPSSQFLPQILSQFPIPMLLECLWWYFLLPQIQPIY